jgi:8-oxo-dGTP diphosphatase
MIEYVFGLAVRVLLTNEQGKILILKRNTDSKTNPGKWELPGGKVDQGESFDKALIREVYEETNLKIALDQVVGVSQQNLSLIRAVHIIMSGKVVEGELNLSGEHEGYAWEFLDNLSDYELADWLENFLINQLRLLNSHEKTEGMEQPENPLNPWIKSIKTSMDKVRGKK